MKEFILKELARTMLNETDFSKHFWEDALSISCYVINHILIRPIINKTLYELY